MATFLDISIVEGFSPIFAAIFVWVVVFALMQTLKIPGDNKNLHAVMSLMLALFVLFVPNVRDLILVISPWFVFLFVVMLFILMAIKMLGVSDGDILSAVKNREGRFILYFVIAFAIVIVVFAFSSKFGQNIGPFLEEGANTSSGSSTGSGDGATNTDDFNKNLQATLFHPKILGMILLLVIASFAIRLLTKAD